MQILDKKSWNDLNVIATTKIRKVTANYLWKKEVIKLSKNNKIENECTKKKNG